MNFTLLQLLALEISDRYNFDVSNIYRHTSGQNQTYIVELSNIRKIFRLYKETGRCDADIVFECTALQHFQPSKTTFCAKPVKDKTGNVIQLIQIDDAIRRGVMFDYVLGDSPILSNDSSEKFGSGLAYLHETMRDFGTGQNRFLPTCINYAAEIFTSYTIDAAHIDNMSDLKVLVDRLVEYELLNIINQDLQNRGFCHGDARLGNVHEYKNTVGFFDFDDCGIGSTLYDLATFGWWVYRQKKDILYFNTFLSKYVSNRHDLKLDYRTLTFYIIVNQIRSIAFLTNFRLDRDIWCQQIDKTIEIIEQFFKLKDRKGQLLQEFFLTQ